MQQNRNDICSIGYSDDKMQCCSGSTYAAHAHENERNARVGSTRMCMNLRVHRRLFIIASIAFAYKTSSKVRIDYCMNGFRCSCDNMLCSILGWWFTVIAAVSRSLSIAYCTNRNYHQAQAGCHNRIKIVPSPSNTNKHPHANIRTPTWTHHKRMQH